VQPKAKTTEFPLGWKADVLTAIRVLNKIEFTNQELYELVPRLRKSHPKNLNIEAKIRQQLQYLRDSGQLVHVRKGLWRIPWSR
jgi:type II restriction enzyme